MFLITWEFIAKIHRVQPTQYVSIFAHHYFRKSYLFQEIPSWVKMCECTVVSKRKINKVQIHVEVVANYCLIIFENSFHSASGWRGQISLYIRILTHYIWNCEFSLFSLCSYKSVVSTTPSFVWVLSQGNTKTFPPHWQSARGANCNNIL